MVTLWLRVRATFAGIGLFCCPHHQVVTRPVDIPRAPMWLFGDKINDVQKQAVETLLSHRRSVPFLLHGPPGTGKTLVVAEAVMQALMRFPDARCDD